MDDIVILDIWQTNFQVRPWSKKTIVSGLKQLHTHAYVLTIRLRCCSKNQVIARKRLCDGANRLSFRALGLINQPVNELPSNYTQIKQSNLMRHAETFYLKMRSPAHF